MVGALELAATSHDKMAKEAAVQYDKLAAANSTVFSTECARLARKLDAGDLSINTFDANVIAAALRLCAMTQQKIEAEARAARDIRKEARAHGFAGVLANLADKLEGKSH